MKDIIIAIMTVLILGIALMTFDYVTKMEVLFVTETSDVETTKGNINQ